jgi:hypothetical protein
VSGQSAAKYAAIALAGAAICLSLIGRSRIWLHSLGGLHVWYHVVLFAVLGGLSMWVSDSPAKRAEWIVWMVVLGFGIEASQAIINHTTMEWGDVGSDIGGIVVGGVAGWVGSLRKANRH